MITRKLLLFEMVNERDISKRRMASEKFPKLTVEELVTLIQRLNTTDLAIVSLGVEYEEWLLSPNGKASVTSVNGHTQRPTLSVIRSCPFITFTPHIEQTLLSMLEEHVRMPKVDILWLKRHLVLATFLSAFVTEIVREKTFTYQSSDEFKSKMKETFSSLVNGDAYDRFFYLYNKSTISKLVTFL